MNSLGLKFGSREFMSYKAVNELERIKLREAKLID